MRPPKTEYSDPIKSRLATLREQFPRYVEVDDDRLVDGIYRKSYAGKMDPQTFLAKVTEPDTRAEIVGQNIVEFGKGLPEGAVGIAGSAVKGAAGVATEAVSAHRINTGNLLARAQQAQSLDPAAWQTLIGDIRSTRVPVEVGFELLGIAQRARSGEQIEPTRRLRNVIETEIRPVAETPVFRAGEKVQDFSQTILPPAPGYEDSIGRELGTGLGSTAAGIGLALIPYAGPLLAMGTFELAGAGEALDRAIAAGANEEQILEAARKGQIPGLTDSLPVEVLLDRIHVPLPAVGRFMQVVARIGVQAAVEGFQEGGQQFLQNVIASEVYDPAQNLTEGVVPSTGVGAGVGAIAEAVATPFRRRRGGGVPNREDLREIVTDPRSLEEITAEPDPVAPAPAPQGSLPAIDTDVTVTLPNGETVQGRLTDVFAAGDQTGLEVADATGERLQFTAGDVTVTPAAEPTPASEDLQALVEDDRPLDDILSEQRPAGAPLPSTPQEAGSAEQTPLAAGTPVPKPPGAADPQVTAIDDNLAAAKAFASKQGNRLQVPILASALNISPATARGLLDRMAAQGDIQKTKQGYRRRAQRRTAQDVLQFLSEQGGLKDQTGDLVAMDAQLFHRQAPFRRRLVNNEDGLTLDQARELLVENGFLEETAFEGGVAVTGTNDVLDLVGRALGGERIVSAADRDLEQARQDQAGVEEQQDQLDQARDGVRAIATDLNERLTDVQIDEIARDALTSGRSVDDVTDDFIERLALIRLDGYNTANGDADTQTNDDRTIQPVEPAAEGRPADGDGEQSANIDEAARGTAPVGPPDVQDGTAQAGQEAELASGTTPEPAREAGFSLPAEQPGRGEQTLIPGVAPVTERDRADARGEQPLRSDREQRPADDGLFDTGARRQTDLLDAPRTTPAQSGKSNRIEDFGEKLEGARKDIFAGFRDALKDDIDVVTEPLSKSFPQPNYEKLAEAGVPKRVLAYVAIMRDMIPHKPRKAFKAQRWAEQVNLLRGFAQRLLDQEIDVSGINDELRLHPTLRDLPLSAAAIEDVAPADLARAAKYRVSSGRFTMLAGERFSPAKSFWFIEAPNGRTMRNAFGNDPSIRGTYRETSAEVVALAKQAIPAELEQDRIAPDTRSKFTKVDVYRDRTTGERFLGFKVRSTVIRLKAGFTDPHAAREYLAENREEIQAKIDAMRKGPNQRGSENRPRSGKNLRAGDITPDMFSDAFGFRGVQFGNYVEGDRRQGDINKAFDALMDLADVLDIPPRALSLNGSLGLAFGARGRGGRNPAAAHFEPGNIVINLTKFGGPGSLAHEWMHALDNYFARQDQAGGFISERQRTSGVVRDEVFQAWRELERALASGSFAERSAEFDKARSKPYWNTTIEKVARAFEKYIIDRLADKGSVNDYLANIDTTSGAYPIGEEMESLGLRAAYDTLFDTMETRAGADGGVELFALERPPRPDLSAKGPVTVVDVTPRFADMPFQQARQAARKFATDELRGDYINENTGWNIEIAKRGIGKSVSGTRSLVDFQVVAELPQLLESAVLVETVSDRQARRNVRAVHVFYGAAKVDGALRRVRLTVIEADNGRRFYDQHSMEIESPDVVALASQGGSPGSSIGPSGPRGPAEASRTINVGVLLSGVKYEDGTPVNTGDFGPSPRGDVFKLASHAAFDVETTPDFEARREAMEAAIRAFLRRVAPQLSGLEIVDGFIAPTGSLQSVGAASYSQLNDIIRVSLAASDPLKATRHEAIHHLNNIGVINDGEWSLLQERAQQEWRAQFDIENRYGDLYRGSFDDDIANRLMDEEAVADAYANWRDGALTVGAPVKRVFEKIRRFWNRLRNMLRGRGFQTTDDVFARIERGEVGARRGDIEEFTIEQAPTPAYVDLYALEPGAEDSGLFGRSFNYSSRTLRETRRDRSLVGLGRLSEVFNAGLHEARVNLQDKFFDLKRIQESIEEARGGKLPEEIDTYLAEELFHGRTGKRLDDFQNNHVEPLIEAINDARLSLETVELYLYARHAPERNAQIARINEELPDGGSGMTNGEAADIMAGFKERGTAAALEAIAVRVDAIQKARRRVLKDGDLIDDVTFQRWEDTYQHYVPLRGFEDIQPEDPQRTRPQTGRGFDIRGEESKRALGRTSKAADIISHTLGQYEESVVRAEKNIVGKTFLKLVQANPNPDVWEVEETLFKRRVNRETGLVEYAPDPSADRRDNVLAVKVGGTVHHITIHHPALAHAMKNLGAESQSQAVRALQKFNRYLAFINTSLNPEFVISNFSRDIQTAAINLQGVDGAKGLTGRIIKDVPKAMAGALGGLRNKNATEWQQNFHAFARAGGKIAFFGLEDIDVRRKRLKAMLSDLDPTKVQKTRIAFRQVFQFVQDVNGAVENGVRLSTFANLRNAGVPDKQAASIARNLTVNFNRKGEWGAVTGALFLFFNATIQGSTRMVTALGRKRVRRFAGGVVLSAMALELINAAVSPEDDDKESKYDKISQWTKDHNIIVMNPWAGEDGSDAVALKVPTPYGYNVFAVLGRKIGEVIRGKSDPLAAAIDVVTAAASSFNPLGGSTDILKTITPTVGKPLLELATNENFAGNPILPEQNPFGVPRPDSQRYWSSASKPARVVTEQLNELTGGSSVRPGAIDVSPETLDHFYNFLTGGAGMFVNRTSDFVLRLANGDEIPWKNVPVARRLIEGNNEFFDFQRYREIRDGALLFEKEQRTLRQAGETEMAKSQAEKFALDRQMVESVKKAERVLKTQRKRRLLLQEDTTMSDAERDAQLETVEDLIRTKMRAVTRKANELKDATP